MNNLSKGKKLFEKYEIIKLIKENDLLKIYLAKKILTNELIIIKLEKIRKNYGKNIIRKKKGILETELYFLNIIKSEQGFPYIKEIKYYDFFNIISVQNFLGEKLIDIFEKKYRYFNIKDITMIAIQILERIKLIHSKNIIHSNINPNNIYIDFSHFKNIIFLSGFSHAIKYGNNINKIYYEKDDLIFSSINKMQNIKLNKKDDLESLGYILIFLLKGELPWELIFYDKNKNYEEKKRKILILKKHYMDINNNILLSDKNIPEEFILFINYIKEIKSNEEIDYNYCFNLFYTIFQKNNIINDGIFSWYQEKIKNNNFIKTKINSYNKYKWQKKFLQKNISFNNITIENKINKIKKSNSCYIYPYNVYNKLFLEENFKNKKNLKKNENSICISSPEEKDYSIEGEINKEEEIISTYKKKKAKKIFKNKIINKNLNNINQTQKNSRKKISCFLNLIKKQKKLNNNNELIIKKIPYFTTRNEKIKSKNKLMSKSGNTSVLEKLINKTKPLIQYNQHKIPKTIQVTRKNSFYKKPRTIKFDNSKRIFKNNIMLPYISFALNNKKIEKVPMKINQDNNYYTIINNSISKLNLIQNVSNIFLTKSYFEEPKSNIYIKPKYKIKKTKRKIKNIILNYDENKKQKNINNLRYNIEIKNEKNNNSTINYYFN